MLVESIFIFVFGLLWGSFSNVVIVRYPGNVIWPRSRCPKCEAQISWFDNIPVLSWLMLRGRCRKCSATISWRYPLVELLTAVIFLLVFRRYGYQWVTLEYLIFAWALVVVSFIDFDHMILPDVFTLSGIILGLAGGAINPERSFSDALLGVLVGGGFLWLIAYLYFVWRKEEGMGGGDIKLLAWIGAVMGWSSIPFVILAASLTGSLVGLLLALKLKSGLKSAIPFGPYLALAAILYLLGGDQIGHWYISLFLPDLAPAN